MSQATWFTIGFKLSKGLPLFLGNFRREASQPCRHFGVRRSRGRFFRDAGQGATRWMGSCYIRFFTGAANSGLVTSGLQNDFSGQKHVSGNPASNSEAFSVEWV